MKFPIVSLMTCLALPVQALSQSTVVEAPVVGVEPIVQVYQERIPFESCREERVRVVEQRGGIAPMPTIVGAVLGGAAGNILGRNSSKGDVITGAGAVLGATIGNQRAQRRRPVGGSYVTEEVCSTEYELREQERVGGYRVSYRYGDSIYETRTDRDPGATIPVRVRLEPIP